MDDLDGIYGYMESKEPGHIEISAREDIINLFESSKKKVFYSRQIEVLLENKYFHWITNRILRELTAEGKIRMEKRSLKLGTELTIYWHPNFRYYKREANNIVELVDHYSEAANSIALGDHCEHRNEGFCEVWLSDKRNGSQKLRR